MKLVYPPFSHYRNRIVQGGGLVTVVDEESHIYGDKS